jgi:hypothetical protein
MTKTMMTFAIALLLATPPLAAPAGAQQPKAAADADTRAVASYRLTMPMVQKVAAAMQTFAAEMQKDPKVAQIAAMEASIAKLEAKAENAELSEAEEKQLEDLQQKKEALENDDDDSSNSGGSIADMEAAVRKQPALLNALQSQGISAREYATFMMAYIQAAMTYGMQKQGYLKEIPAGVNVENVKFMSEHEAELAIIQKQFEALEKKARP